MERRAGMGNITDLLHGVAPGTKLERTPEVKGMLKEYMQKHTRQVGREHFELAMWLAEGDHSSKTDASTADSELLSVVYKTLVSPVLSPKSRAEGYALAHARLTDGQRQMVWEVQLESFPAHIPSLKEYWSPDVRKNMSAMQTMVARMEITELMERMRSLSPILKENLSPEVLIPIISRLADDLDNTPAYAEPPSRIMVRELLASLPPGVRSSSEVSRYEQPDNEVALNWDFVCNCLSQRIDLPVLPPANLEVTGQRNNLFHYFPRTSRDAMTHLGNVAEFVMRQAGNGDQSCVKYTYMSLSLLSEDELKKRLSKPEVQSAIASNPSLGTVVFFEIRQREEQSAGGGERSAWDSLREQLQLTHVLSPHQSGQMATGTGERENVTPNEKPSWRKPMSLQTELQ